MTRVGEVLDGKYELTRLLGRGGMGEVYVARHKHIGKDVAIKFLRRDLTSDDDAMMRFAREARAAAAVGHRGIVDIYDVGTCSDGAPYLVMELLEGVSLRAILEGHAPLTVGQTAAIACELLAALAAAHDKGIVHRDLKPDNVFIERSDGPLSVKLLDFGIAKMTEGGQHVTQTGRPMGTAPYMSPEQVRGARDLDARVDVYAVGVMLYESLAGRLPYVADNYNAMIVQILTEQAPALGTLRPELPAEIEQIVMRALAKDAQQRYQTAEELAVALRPHADPAAARRLVPAVTKPPVDLATAPTIRGTEVPVVSAAGSLGRTGAPGARRRWLRNAGAVALAAAGVWTIWALSSPGQRPTAPARLVRAAAERAAPVRSEIVTITVEGAPPGARVIFDGARVTELPIRIAPRATMVPLRVEADGFVPETQMILPSRDRRVRVSLVAATPAALPAPPVVPRRKGTGTVRPAPPRGTSSPIDTDTTEFDE